MAASSGHWYFTLKITELKSRALCLKVLTASR
ncbi:hypothetical protein P4S73_07480 [Paraglaciecola sp. Hal342]